MSIVFFLKTEFQIDSFKDDLSQSVTEVEEGAVNCMRPLPFKVHTQESIIKIVDYFRTLLVVHFQYKPLLS